MIPEGHASPARLVRMLDVLERLFCRDRRAWNSRNSAEAFDNLMLAFARGEIRAVRRRIPLDICMQATRAQGHSRESRQHAYMKRAGVIWMRANGAEDAAPEISVGRYRFDGYSRGADWILEVGNTNAMKLEFAIDDDWARRFTLIPFQGDFDFLGEKEPPTRGLVAIDFEWSAGLELESPW
jgi:hypothetical protein